MDRAEDLIKKFGLCPCGIHRAEIKQLLLEEIVNHDYSEGSGDYLSVLCFMLFFIGKVEDSALVWQAKMLNMDTACTIDVGLLCGAGIAQTIDFISTYPNCEKMKSYIERCVLAGDLFDRDLIVQNFKQYYGCM